MPPSVHFICNKQNNFFQPSSKLWGRKILESPWGRSNDEQELILQACCLLKVFTRDGCFLYLVGWCCRAPAAESTRALSPSAAESEPHLDCQGSPPCCPCLQSMPDRKGPGVKEVQEAAFIIYCRLHVNASAIWSRKWCTIHHFN